MVGVPGKYKGCNTCRRRRVRCGMERPACKKCEDSGRECAGYERDLTFIVGTQKEKGRCSSHPHRSILKANQEKKAASTPPKRRVTPTNVTSVPEPWTTPSPSKDSETETSSSCIFVHTPSLHFYPRYENDSDIFTLPDLPTTLPFLGNINADRQLSIRGFAFVEDNSPEQGDDGDGHRRQRRRTQLRSSPTSAPRQSESTAEPKTLYIFQTTTDQSEEETTFAHILGGMPDQVKAQVPAAFQDSPANQFFARLWRPLVITSALQHEKQTFLERQHWSDGPFEKVNKTNFDLLWDIVANLPGILERARRTVDITDRQKVNYPLRSLKARDLLGSCLGLQKDFDRWFNSLKGDEEADELRPLHWPVASSPAPKPSRRRSSTAIQSSPFNRQEFRGTQTAQLLVSYWSALIVFYNMVAEVLVVAEPPQDSGPSSQLAYRPSTGASPAYNSSSPQASVSSTSATSPPVSINASEHSGYGNGIATTEGYAYYSTVADTSLNPQLPPSIFLPQQETQYMNFSTDVYSPTISYAPVTTYAPNPGFTDTSFTPMFDTSMSMFPAQPTDFDFSNLEYINVDTTYLPGVGSNGAGNGMDYLPPPQRNPTPASYISAPGSNNGSHMSGANSHHSPANSWVSSAGASHAATPPDMNGVMNGGGNTANVSSLSSKSDGSLFNAPTGTFAVLYQTSRPANLVRLSKLIGAGLDYLLNSESEAEVVLMLWPLGVLESMCSEHERMWCADLRRKLEAAAESTGRSVRSKRWRAVGEGAEEED